MISPLTRISRRCVETLLPILDAEGADPGAKDLVLGQLASSEQLLHVLLEQHHGLEAQTGDQILAHNHRDAKLFGS